VELGMGVFMIGLLWCTTYALMNRYVATPFVKQGAAPRSAWPPAI